VSTASTRSATSVEEFRATALAKANLLEFA
jgi:hypothetical protein